MRIQVSTVILLWIVAIFFLATPNVAQRNDRWQTINAEGLFTFRLPDGFNQSEMGIDSFMRGYKRGSARFIFVCGKSASFEFNEKNMRDLREAAISIDGKHATVRTFLYVTDSTSRYITELNVGDWRNQDVELYMGMYSPDHSNVGVARKIFKSVKFLKTGCA